MAHLHKNQRLNQIKLRTYGSIPIQELRLISIGKSCRLREREFSRPYCREQGTTPTRLVADTQTARAKLLFEGLDLPLSRNDPAPVASRLLIGAIKIRDTTQSFYHERFGTLGKGGLPQNG